MYSVESRPEVCCAVQWKGELTKELLQKGREVKSEEAKLSAPAPSARAEKGPVELKCFPSLRKKSVSKIQTGNELPPRRVDLNRSGTVLTLFQERISKHINFKRGHSKLSKKITSYSAGTI